MCRAQDYQIFPVSISRRMKKAFVIAVLLLTFFTDGNALSCVTCYSSEADYCTEPPSKCPEGADVCVSKYLRTIMNDMNITHFNRKCDTSSKSCNKVESYTSDTYAEMITIDCCKTDNCDPGKSQHSPFGGTENGVECGACFLTSTTTCTPEKKIQCRGIEKLCFLLINKQKDKSEYVSARGCASPDFCASENTELNFKTCNTTDKTPRKDDANHAEHCFFLLPITILLHLYSTILLSQCQDSL